MTATIGPAGRAMVDGSRSPEDLANGHVRRWVEDCAAMCQPDRIVCCDGSLEERKALFEQGVRDGVFVRLNQEKLPGCYLHRSNTNDVARTEQLTFICTPSQDMAGPTMSSPGVQMNVSCSVRATSLGLLRCR